MSRIDSQDAKQGRKGTQVLRILVVALILMAIAGVGMAIYGWAMPDQTLPEAGAGGGLTSPTPSTTPATPGTTTVTPQTGNTTNAQ